MITWIDLVGQACARAASVAMTERIVQTAPLAARRACRNIANEIVIGLSLWFGPAGLSTGAI
jgi:hypothetical protein